MPFGTYFARHEHHVSNYNAFWHLFRRMKPQSSNFNAFWHLFRPPEPSAYNFSAYRHLFHNARRNLTKKVSPIINHGFGPPFFLWRKTKNL